MDAVDKVRTSIIFVYFLFVLTPFVLAPSIGVAAEANKFSDLRITVEEVNDLPLRDVVGKIKQQTGYSVLLSESLVSIPVSGMYDDISVENFFTRVLRGKNISILSDDNERIVVVKAFGDKTLIAGRNVDEKNLEKLVPGMNITYEDYKKQEELDQAALDEMLNDPDTIEPVSGMALGELRRQEEKDMMELENAQQDPETVIPDSGGVTVGESREREKLAKESLEKALNDPNTVDPMSGMTLSEIRRIEKEDGEALQKALNDPDTIEPMTGLTLRELQKQGEK